MGLQGCNAYHVVCKTHLIGSMQYIPLGIVCNTYHWCDIHTMIWYARCKNPPILVCNAYFVFNSVSTMVQSLKSFMYSNMYMVYSVCFNVCEFNF